MTSLEDSFIEVTDEMEIAAEHRRIEMDEWHRQNAIRREIAKAAEAKGRQQMLGWCAGAAVLLFLIAVVVNG